MPWTPEQFASRHNKALRGSAAAKAASIANAVLKRSGDEGMAIATANKFAETHRADGGSAPQQQPAQPQRDPIDLFRWLVPASTQKQIGLAPQLPQPHGDQGDPQQQQPQRAAGGAADRAFAMVRRANGGPAPIGIPLPGELHSLSRFDSLGTTRPFGPGEWLQNPDGSWSNERTSTVQNSALNGGRPSVVPGLWIRDGRPVLLNEDQAAEMAARSGLTFPAFDTMKQAETFARQREAQWQTAPEGDSAGQSPLWSQPSPRAAGGASDRAYRVARRQSGGMSGMMPEVPFFERQEAYQLARGPYGLAVGTGGGRTDKNSASVASGSYVLPADVVAGLGDGNTLAGAKVFNEILGSMPWGITPPRSMATHRPPSPPHDPALMAGITGTGREPISPMLADGGETKEEDDKEGVPILSADGEITLSPEDVLRVGQHYAPDRERESGNIDAMMRRGHRVLDHFTKLVRGQTIKHLKSLRGPVGSKNASQGHA